MTVFGTRYLAAFAATAVLALGLYGCGGGGGGGPSTGGYQMMPDEGMTPPDYVDGLRRGTASALANAFDLTANDGRMVGSDYVSSWSYQSDDEELVNSSVSLSHRDGAGTASVRVSRDENGKLLYNFSKLQRELAPLQNEVYWNRLNRHIDTGRDSKTVEGVTTSERSMPESVHNLGSDWTVAQLTSRYDGAGTLDVIVATDLGPSEMPIYPYRDANDAKDDHVILLDGAPERPDGWDALVVWLPSNETFTGSLDGNAGGFTCTDGDGCLFVEDVTFADDAAVAEFYLWAGDASFTPTSGGMDETVTGIRDLFAAGAVGPENAVDYLMFGSWLYVPENVMDTDAYDFGVYASGGDPFNVSNLEGLTGSATYKGSASGVHYTGVASGSETIGTFSARVELTADFGASDAHGTVNGEVNNINYGANAPSGFPTAVALTKDIYNGYATHFGVQVGEANIFDREPYADGAMPGGWIDGTTRAEVDGAWWGSGHWVGQFFGNGATSSDHPSSIAGAFGVSNYNGDGLTGSFGAHKQDDQQ